MFSTLPKTAAEANAQILARKAAKSQADNQRRARNAARIMRVLALASFDGSKSNAQLARSLGYSGHAAVLKYFSTPRTKADLEGHSSLTDEPGAELLGTGDAVAQFLNAANYLSALFSINATIVPPNVSLSAFDSELGAFYVPTGKAIPVSRMDLSARFTVDLLNIVAMGVFTRELLEHSEAERIIEREAPAGLARATDSLAFSLTAPQSLLAGATEIPSGGSTQDDVLFDIDELVTTLTNAGSGLALLLHWRSAQKLALLVNSSGQYAFPELSASGGRMAGLPVITSDGMPTNAIVAVDGREVLLAPGGATFAASRNASIEMADDPAQDVQGPTAPTGKVVSLFQTESTAIAIARPVGFRMRRADAVGFISGLDLSGVVSTA